MRDHDAHLRREDDTGPGPGRSAALIFAAMIVLLMLLTYLDAQ